MRISDWSSDVCSSDLVLLDTTQDAADKGKAYSTGLLDKDLKKARITVEGKEQLLARIKATTVYDDLKGCDLIIEAVFEDRTVKADVTRKAEAVLAKTAIFASTTSTLPITGLAQASERPKNFNRPTGRAKCREKECPDGEVTGS